MMSVNNMQEFTTDVGNNYFVLTLLNTQKKRK